MGTLDYNGEANSGRWRIWRRFVLLSLVPTITLAGWHWQSAVTTAICVQYSQWQCMRYERSPQTLAYDSDHRHAASVAKSDAAFYEEATFGFTYHPGVLDYFARQNTSVPPRAVFVHERISPSGHRRLVMVLGPCDFNLDFYRQVLTPAPWFGNLQRVPAIGTLAEDINLNWFPVLEDDSDDTRFSFDPKVLAQAKRDKDRQLKQSLRVYFGQADPANASHFTIRYEIGDEPGTIDAWLGDDDAVRMQAHGPWATPPRTNLLKNGKDVMAP